MNSCLRDVDVENGVGQGADDPREPEDEEADGEGFGPLVSGRAQPLHNERVENSREQNSRQVYHPIFQYYFQVFHACLRFLGYSLLRYLSTPIHLEKTQRHTVLRNSFQIKAQKNDEKIRFCFVICIF